MSPLVSRAARLAAAFLLVAPVAAQSTRIPAGRAATGVPLDASLGGLVRSSPGGALLGGVRVTLFRPDLSFFREIRTAADGSWALDFLPRGSFRLGAATPGRQYVEVGVTLAGGPELLDLDLPVESESGRWDVIGDTLPETLDATDIGILRPDGTILYCHDTTDPIVFDPVTGAKSFPPPSGSPQGCMNGTLLADGSALLAGGQNGADPGDFVNGIPWVKRLGLDDAWEQLPDMLLSAGRWYPGLARLADGRLLVMGGGMAPDATRTDTCEVFDPLTRTWSFTGSMNSPVEFPPSALLHDGRVLRTWGTRPQLWDPSTGLWSDTGQLVFAARGYPGHSDHSMLVLDDGRALIVGASRLAQPAASMTELYDPASGTWSAGTSPALVRMQPEVVLLPDGRVFVGAGDKESSAGPEPNVLGIVRRCDLLEPATGAWRQVGDMRWYREYHAVTLLVPDGRVLTTGGTRIKFQFGPQSADIEAWSPPYLFRGVRPRLAELSDASPPRGTALDFRVFPDTRLTSVVLMGVPSTTHWVDAGIPRRVVLPVEQSGAQARVLLPADANLLPLGWYLLFGMVDDIPSEALLLRVDP